MIAKPSPSLPPEDAQALRDFLRFALGDGHLTVWEENFLNSIKQALNRPAVWLSKRQQAIILQLQDKLHFNRQHEPLPAIDPDGIEENNDPDGWPTAKHAADQTEDEAPLDFLIEV